MRGYFIDSAKSILKGEGLRSISVRNIAENAGYSYATLYNYFKDIKDLIFECVKDFQEECEEMVLKDSRKAERGREKIMAISRSFIKYFVQYPGTFELFYIERVSDVGSKKNTVELIATFFDRLCSGEWDYVKESKIISAELTGKLRSNLNYTVTGMLLLYINRRTPASYKEFTSSVDEQLNYILSW